MALAHEMKTSVESFGAASTTDEVLAGVDLSGRRVFMTGVSSGLGLETARALLAHGARVVGAVRNRAQAEAVNATLAPAAENGGGIDFVELDLSSLASVRACADRLVEAQSRFDDVIANAGVMTTPRSTTVDGFETHFGVNHLGHFMLVNRIAPLILDGGRVVSLTSGSHRHSDVDLDDLNVEHAPYTLEDAYGRSKSATMLFAVEFDARHRGRGVRATGVHPGRIDTGITRTMPAEMREAQIARIAKKLGSRDLVFRSIPQGAATIVWAGFVAPPETVAARFCEDCHVAPVNDDPAVPGGVRSYVVDPERARTLWAKSEELVGEHF